VHLFFFSPPFFLFPRPPPIKPRPAPGFPASRSAKGPFLTRRCWRTSEPFGMMRLFYSLHEMLTTTQTQRRCVHPLKTRVSLKMECLLLGSVFFSFFLLCFFLLSLFVFVSPHNYFRTPEQYTLSKLLPFSHPLFSFSSDFSRDFTSKVTGSAGHTSQSRISYLPWVPHIPPPVSFQLQSSLPRQLTSRVLRTPRSLRALVLFPTPLLPSHYEPFPLSYFLKLFNAGRLPLLIKGLHNSPNDWPNSATPHFSALSAPPPRFLLSLTYITPFLATKSGPFSRLLSTFSVFIFFDRVPHWIFLRPT